MHLGMLNSYTLYAMSTGEVDVSSFAEGSAFGPTPGEVKAYQRQWKL
jgi:hypothetical protein